MNENCRLTAGPDAYVTAHHLRDMLNEASVEQLVEWSQKPGLLPRVPAGAARGRSWADLDEGALQGFAADRDNRRTLQRASRVAATR